MRSVLNLMPIYLLPDTMLPRSSLQILECLFRNFLCSSSRRELQFMLWHGVFYVPLQDGGRGIQSLLIIKREKAIARHVARFLLELESLWCFVIRAKHGAWMAGGEIRAP